MFYDEKQTSTDFSLTDKMVNYFVYSDLLENIVLVKDL